MAAAQRVLAVLLRPTCVSLAVSNHYVSLAEPLGALMLRNLGPQPAPPFSADAAARHGISRSSPAPLSTSVSVVPKQTLLRMLKGVSSDLDGIVWGAEHFKYAQVLGSPPQLLSLGEATQQQQQQARAVQKDIAGGSKKDGGLEQTAPVPEGGGAQPCMCGVRTSTGVRA